MSDKYAMADSHKALPRGGRTGSRANDNRRVSISSCIHLVVDRILACVTIRRLFLLMS